MNSSIKISVLIIDGDQDVRDIAKEALNSLYNTTVIEAEDGVEAELKGQRQKFDLVIMDTLLPKKDGGQVLKVFEQAEWNSRPRNVLIFSQRPIDVLGQLSYSAGPLHYLKKPCTIEHLKAKIKEIIEPPTVDQAGMKLGIDLMNVFIEATIEVFSVMVSTLVEKESVFVRSSDQMSGDVSAIFALQGPQISGSLAIAFEEKCILYTASKMLGEPLTELSHEMSDVAGEIGNQILGVGKRKLNPRGYILQPALPSVVTGKNHHIRHLVQCPIFAVRFKTPGGYFTIEISVQRTPS